MPGRAWNQPWMLAVFPWKPDLPQRRPPFDMRLWPDESRGELCHSATRSINTCLLSRGHERQLGLVLVIILRIGVADRSKRRVPHGGLEVELFV